MGYIRKEQEHYFVSLTALVQLDIEPAHQVLENAEALFVQLKAHYLETQREHIQVAVLARRANLREEDVRRTLVYMLESPSWRAGWSTNLFHDPAASVLPSEGVLRFKSFASMIDELSAWQVNRLQGATTGEVDAHPFPTRRPRSTNSRPDWFGKLPTAVQEIMSEVYASIELNLRALPAMGIRAVIDIVCVDLIGDVGSFEQKVTMLRTRNLISDADRVHIMAAVDVGNASAHRGHVPDQEDVGTLLSVCERLVHGYYVLPTATQRLRSNTPPRAARKRAQQ